MVSEGLMLRVTLGHCSGPRWRFLMLSSLGLVLLPLLSTNALAESMFRCRMNATASRDFSYVEKRPSWCGGVDSCGFKASWETHLYSQARWEDISYREHLILINDQRGLVTVKSFWSSGKDGKRFSEEFVASIVSQDSSVVFLDLLGIV